MGEQCYCGRFGLQSTYRNRSTGQTQVLYKVSPPHRFPIPVFFPTRPFPLCSRCRTTGRRDVPPGFPPSSTLDDAWPVPITYEGIVGESY